ncbi:hypothetical protein AMS68_007825 [Peltaster fructicola]|uniref:Chromo domain-containing protein n=1 Tax=Peltaster fructicola TaxID=286661 RepID=A0A6H0Y631_9PEZI|nr:hypothetical protein AMS68_007825 [Peltaster fructicola]
MSYERERNSCADEDAELAQSSSEDESEHYHFVDEIVAHRYDEHNVLQYLVKWRGFEEPKDHTWEYEDTLNNVQEDLMAYHIHLGFVPGFGDHNKKPVRKKPGRPRVKYADQSFKVKACSKSNVSTPSVNLRRTNRRAGHATTSRALAVNRSLTEITSPTTLLQLDGSLRTYPDVSWEELIVSIGKVVYDCESMDAATHRRSTIGWMTNIRWTDGHMSYHDVETLCNRCPRRMCAWFVQHLYLAEQPRDANIPQQQIPRYARLVDGTWRV